MDLGDLMLKPKCGLLALLPKPKNVNIPAGKNKSTLLIPLSLQKLSAPAKVEGVKRKFLDEETPSTSKQTKVKKPKALSLGIAALADYESSSGNSDLSDSETIVSNSVEKKFSDDDDSAVDFLGINLKPLDVFPSNDLISENDIVVGPARPHIMTYTYPTVEANFCEATQPTNSISDQDLAKMIYEKELAPFGGSTILAREAANSIIDVSVDNALGPNVRQNLLKNLNNKVMAQVAVGPLPKVKKDPKDRLSKQKHQITHLAGLAVAREEMLQEQWADNKQKKKASARRYGF